MSLFSMEFKDLRVDLAASLVDLTNSGALTNNLSNSSNTSLSKPELDLFLTKFDLKRLESYNNNKINVNVMLDLVPILARLYFTRKIVLNLSPSQMLILLGVGLQLKSFEHIRKEFNDSKKEKISNSNKYMENINNDFIMGNFKKIILRMTSKIKEIYKEDIIQKEDYLIKGNNKSNNSGNNGNGSSSKKKNNNNININTSTNMLNMPINEEESLAKSKKEYYDNFLGKKRKNSANKNDE